MDDPANGKASWGRNVESALAQDELSQIIRFIVVKCVGTVDPSDIIQCHYRLSYPIYVEHLLIFAVSPQRSLGEKSDLHVNNPATVASHSFVQLNDVSFWSPSRIIRMTEMGRKAALALANFLSLLSSSGERSHSSMVTLRRPYRLRVEWSKNTNVGFC